jgi:hypothetical protein
VCRKFRTKFKRGINYRHMVKAFQASGQAVQQPIGPSKTRMIVYSAKFLRQSLRDQSIRCKAIENVINDCNVRAAAQGGNKKDTQKKKDTMNKLASVLKDPKSYIMAFMTERLYHRTRGFVPGHAVVIVFVRLGLTPAAPRTRLDLIDPTFPKFQNVLNIRTRSRARKLCRRPTRLSTRCT